MNAPFINDEQKLAAAWKLIPPRTRWKMAHRFNRIRNQRLKLAVELKRLRDLGVSV